VAEEAEGNAPDRNGAALHRASALLRQVLVLNEELEHRVRRQLDTSETDLRAMQHLMRRRQMTPTELAEALHLSTAATTTVIDRLVRRGHAIRTPHPDDRRRTLIRPERAAADRVMAVLRPLIQETDAVVQEMPSSARQAVVDYLESVIGAMRSTISRLQPEAGALLRQMPRDVLGDAPANPFTDPPSGAAGGEIPAEQS
jgi:DNA-binding MarR family transcriptional regulator